MTAGSLPLTVIGGYLGAGKTTLVNAILSGASGQRIAVIVNDFGSVNIDLGLIGSRDGNTISLTNGCMCCSAADGTARALSQIVARSAEFDRIVIESSGVAEPGKIAQNAHGFRLALDGVLVLADAEQLPKQASNRYVGDVVRRQLRQADLIILNKIDLVSNAALAAVRALISDIAPLCPVIETRRSDAPLSVLLGIGPSKDKPVPASEPADAADLGFSGHGARYRTWLTEPEGPLTREAFTVIASDLASRAIRAKGYVLLSDQPHICHVYQQVGGRWSLNPTGAWPDGIARTRIVAIALADS